MGKEIIMKRVASAHNFNLTGTLNHVQVQQLANAWLPQIRFHEKEMYHPISLLDYFEIPGNIYTNLTPVEKEDYKIDIVVPDGPSYKVETFEPAVLKNQGPVRMQQPNVYVRTSNVLASLAGIVEKLLNDDISSETVITQGNGDKGTRFFFASKKTVSGEVNPGSGNPYLPEHDIKILAEYKVLIDLLEYELIVQEERGYPLNKDALRKGFSITWHFFIKSDEDNEPIGESIRRNIMKGLIAAYKSGNDVEFQNIIGSIPEGWSFNFNNWEILKRYSFMEYYFYYACSNWSDYELFGNYHEGDIEGCCIVFETTEVEMAFSLPDPDPLNVPPVSVITSVHEDFQNLDLYKSLDPLHAREDLKVWIALGSHATYLSPGNHDMIDLGFLIVSVAEKSLLGFLLLSPIIVPILILISIVEHFIDTEDQTSDLGGYTDSNIPDGSEDRHFQCAVETTPLSENNNIYTNDYLEALAIRSYHGKYGETSGIIDNSGGFGNKSGRYFKKVTINLKIDLDIIL